MAILNILDDGEFLAKETRAALAELAAKFALGDGKKSAGMSQDAVKEVKAAGAAAFEKHVEYFGSAERVAQRSLLAGWELLQAMFWVHAKVVCGPYQGPEKDPEYRSYYWEGASAAFSRAKHAAGLSGNAVFEFVFNSMCTDYSNTNIMQDQVLHQLGLRSDMWEFDAPCTTIRQLNGNTSTYRFSAKDRVRPSFQASCAGIELTAEDAHYGSNCRFLLYTVGGEPMVAGYLTPLDSARGRFTRKRLGALLKHAGYGEGDVKCVVNACNTGGSVTFDVLPNDMSWETAYVDGGVDSCMSYEASSYKTWNDIHPVEAYSSALHGSGDNGLALFTVNREGGADAGRGIYNINTGEVVRWYGNHRAECTLKDMGIKISRGGLAGSWLTLLLKPDKKFFVCPYVDGVFSQGRVDREANRVYFLDDDKDGVSLSDTRGKAERGGMFRCLLNGRMYEPEEMTHQPEQNNYIRTAELARLEWRCPVINEYASDGQRSIIWLDGVRTEVCDRVAFRQGTYLSDTNYCRHQWVRNPKWQARYDTLRAIEAVHTGQTADVITPPTSPAVEETRSVLQCVVDGVAMQNADGQHPGTPQISSSYAEVLAAMTGELAAVGRSCFPSWITSNERNES